MTPSISSATRELGRIFDECRSDAACDAAYPNLEERLWALSARFEREPETIVLRDAAGAETEVAVTTAERGGFQPLAPLIGQVRNQLYGSLPVGMYLGVICAEDAPRLGAGGVPAGRTPLAETGMRLAEACRSWPVAPAPAGHLAQPRLATPTLVLTGALDPATNAASGSRLAEGLDRSVHLVMAATGHGPLFPECARPAVAHLLETGGVEGVAADCSAVPLPPFAVPQVMTAAAAR